jgi:hypothetical protein
MNRCFIGNLQLVCFDLGLLAKYRKKGKDTGESNECDAKRLKKMTDASISMKNQYTLSVIV